MKTENLNSSCVPAAGTHSSKKLPIAFRLGMGLFIAAACSFVAGCKVEVPEMMQKNIEAKYEMFGNDMKSGLEGDFKQKTDDAVASFNQKADGVISDFNQKTEQTNAELSRLVTEKILGNEVAAKEAFEKAKEFAANGYKENARIYCLNAINHTPNKAEYFDKLVHELTPAENAALADLEQNLNLLQIGIFQVDSADVPAMQKMLVETTAKIEVIEDANAQAAAAENQAAREKMLASVGNDGEFSWEKACGNVEIAKNRLQALNDIIEFAGTDDVFADDLTKTAILVECDVAIEAIRNYLTKAETLLNGGEFEKNSASISSMVQSANNILSQTWSLKLDALSADRLENLKAQANRIAKLEKDFNYQKSLPAYEEILRIKNYSPTTTKYTQAIEIIQKNIRSASDKMAEIYDLELQKKVAEIIRDWNKKLERYSQYRYEAYQMWAVSVCREAYRQESDTTLYTSERQAAEIIKNTILQIDATLLIPEIRNLYDEIYVKLWQNLAWEEQVKAVDPRSGNKKKTLEDF